MRRIDVQVLIVGGGGAGLTASNLLSGLGVSSLLVERHPATSHLPKAHYLNQRTMEIFREAGLADAVYARSAPPENMDKVIWHTSLGGEGPLDAKVIYAVDALGGGRYAADHAEKGVTRTANVAQIHLEPILRDLAEQANPGHLRFEHEFIRFDEVDDGIEAVVRDLNAGEDYIVSARYLIAADGGKTLAPALGLQMVGPTGLSDHISVYFKADLSRYIPDDTSVMRIIMRVDQKPGQPPVGGLLAYGPSWDRHSEEWSVGWGYAKDDPERHNWNNIDKSVVSERVQQFLKVDVPIEVIRVSPWGLEAVVADRFQVGRVLLIGDAAHRHTPGGGLGLNSGVQDAHNICWKLALVLSGRASAALLDTYEQERRPVVTRNAQNSLLVFDNHLTVTSAMGLMVGAPKEANEANFAKLFTDTEDGRARRARVERVFDGIMGCEYGPYDLEMGFQYDSTAIVQDGTPWPARDPLGVHYEPSTHPGCRLPHVWLHENGRAVSTHDLLPRGGFLLLTGSDGGKWAAAANRIAAERDLPMRAVSVGRGCEIGDPTGGWERIAQIESGGAILVRPDGHVCFRAVAMAPNPATVLDSAFGAILATA